MKGILKLVALAGIAITVIACGESNPKPDVKLDEPVNFTEANQKEIEKYISDNNLDAKKTASGLYYVIEKEGEGKNPIVSSTVRVAYKGSFTNGKVFDQSDAEGISFPLNRVIKGWTEGIPLFKVGGEGKLLIPSNLGYGNGGTGGIPGGSVLVFDIKLLEIK